MSVELIGSKQFTEAVLKINRDGKVGIDRLMERAARETGNIAKKNIQGGGRSGRIYKRRSVSHQASAVGEFPKTDRGDLVRNINHRKEGFANYVVGTTNAANGAPHGLFLELKAPSGGGRPWLLPSVEEYLKKFERQAKEMLK